MSETNSTPNIPSGTPSTSTPAHGTPKAAPAKGTNTPNENDTKKAVPDVARTTADHGKDAVRSTTSEKDATKHTPDVARTTADHGKDTKSSMPSGKDADKHAPDATRTGAKDATKATAPARHTK